jgi:hypothetical protein
MGCVPSYVLPTKDRNALQEGGKALVLVRIQCTVDNEPTEPFVTPSLTADPIIFFGLGTFETVGEPIFAGHRFLSDESRRAGWTYFVLSPGLYYLAVMGPDSSATSKVTHKSLREAPRWRIDIPENGKLIYVGTLHLAGKSEGKLLFGGKVIAPVSRDELIVSNEEELAKSLLSEYFPDADQTRTILMKRWYQGDPIIIRSPKHDSRK